jgi:hypothetical protein
MRAALVLAAVATIYLGVVPGRVLDYADWGADALRKKTDKPGFISIEVKDRAEPTPVK